MLDKTKNVDILKKIGIFWKETGYFEKTRYFQEKLDIERNSWIFEVNIVQVFSS